MKKIVIVGGVAGGAATAARARRLDENASITLIERGPDVSFANCGMPYYIGGEIRSREALAVQTPQSLRALLAIDVRTRTEAVKINRDQKTLSVKNLETGECSDLPYDKLVLAPGASPVLPPLPGLDPEKVFTLRNLQDMDKIFAKVGTARRATVVGAGFIGVEISEAFRHRGLDVALVEAAPQILPVLDAEMTRTARAALERNGVKVFTEEFVVGFEGRGNGEITTQLKSGKALDSDFVVLSIGVAPESKLAREAGLTLGLRGAVSVNEWQQTSDSDIYAVGDAVETRDRVAGGRVVLPMAGPANRQGRVAADHIFLGEKAKPYPGSAGTAIVRAFDVAAGITGWNERRAKQENLDYAVATVTDTDHASYYPGAQKMTLKILWEKPTGRILGAQVFGSAGVDKRLDVFATAIAAKMTIDDITHLELSYAPPFGSAKDIVNLAGFQAGNLAAGLAEAIWEMPPVFADDEVLLDVRSVPVAKASPIPGATHIPMAQLRSRLGELDKNKTYIIACAVGKTAYFAARVLTQKGFKAKFLAGGALV